MPLMEHLVELRKRLLISFAAIALCGIVVFIFYSSVLHFLSGPYEQVTRNSQGCGRHGCKLIVTGPLDPLMVRLKVAGYGGLALSVPIVMWEIWRFIVPGLHRASAATRWDSSSGRSCCSRWAAWWHGSRSRRPSTSCSASAGRSCGRSSTPTST